MSNEAVELEPWVIVFRHEDDSRLALWRIDGQTQDSLVFFSDREHAEQYAQAHLTSPWQTKQVRGNDLIRLLADCYRQGMQFAALNPNAGTAQQVFALRDVLKAARDDLRTQFNIREQKT